MSAIYLYLLSAFVCEARYDSEELLKHELLTCTTEGGLVMGLIWLYVYLPYVNTEPVCSVFMHNSLNSSLCQL